MTPDTAPTVLVELYDAAGLVCRFVLSRVPNVGERIDGRYIVTAVDHVPRGGDDRLDARARVAGVTEDEARAALATWTAAGAVEEHEP